MESSELKLVFESGELKMIKNIRMKRFLVNNIFPVFSLINKIIPKDDKTIFFYCANDELNDNSEAVFNYLVEHGYNERYKIICGVGHPKRYKNRITKNVSFIPKSKCILQYMKSGHVLYCMGKMPIKPTKKQTVIHMWHGVPLKKIGLLTNISNGKEFFFTYVCAPSETWRPIMAAAFGCPPKNVCICGEPKADKLLIPKKESNEKLVVWAPTFRQSEYLGYNDSKQENLLPLFNQNEWEELNDYLKARNVRVIVKLHPMQDLMGLTSFKLSHFEIYGAETFVKVKGDIFEVMSQSDALISDYSGLFLDYLVLDRPICFVLDDYKDYQNTRGFVFDNPLDYMPGHKAYVKDDLFAFLDDVAGGKDRHSEERKNVNALVNAYSDGKNCERVIKIAGIS